MPEQLWMRTLSYDRPAHWSDRANCRGKAFELFEYQDADSPLAAGMSTAERRAFNDTNFELAAEICIECPVFFECKESATEEDRVWTVRAGEPPARSDADEARSLAYFASARKDPEVCARGHAVPGGGRCKTCKREANRKNARVYRARQRAERGVE